MDNKLQQYFPVIRTKGEIMEKIENDESLRRMFYHWTEEQRREFLDFCTGVRGIKIMYDFAGREILNPEYNPERVEELLSLLLGQKVQIVEVLPGDSTRIADEASLVVMDIVVQLGDGSIANLEIQKIGYKFPGERSACYSADLLLRQYKRIRSTKRKKFSYKDIKHVYTIVLFEKSPAAFHRFPHTYLHRFEQKSDTGLEVNLLQKYLFISLDIFRKIKHNENSKIKIENRLDAWLTFMSMDEPDAIISIIERYPDFKIMYEEAYAICRNIEEVMSMFSEELRELDRNTVQLMIDEMQEEIDEMQKELNQKKRELNGISQELEKSNKELEKSNQELEKILEQSRQQMKQKDRKLEELEQAYREVLERLSKLEKR